MRIIVSGYFGAYPSITESVADALTRHGHVVRVHELYAPTFSINLGHTRTKVLPRLPGHLERSQKALSKLIEEFQPDVLFVLRGDEVDLEELKTLRDRFGFKIWQWIYDPLAKAPGTLDLAEMSDRVFHYSAAETLSFKERFSGKNIEFLPGAFDDRFHGFSPETGSQTPTHDIFFCGALAPPLYRNRLETLESISRADSGLGITAYYKPSTFNIMQNRRFTNMLRRDYPSLYGNWKLRGLSRRQLVTEYHRSIAALNLHDLNMPGVGLSWRTFEILGSGGIMITDRHPELETCFGGQLPFEVFDAPEDIITIALGLKADPDRCSAIRKMVKRVSSLHSYYHRMRTILPPNTDQD